MMTSPTSLAGAGLTELSATHNAKWLPPSAWPEESGWLFQPRPLDRARQPAVASRWDDVTRIVKDGEVWHRNVPLTAVPRHQRHCLLDATWSTDGDVHTLLRGGLLTINRGSTGAARQFTRALTAELLSRLMSQEPPWNLAAVVSEVSARVIIEHTLQAPALLRDARRLRELVRQVGAAEGGFFGVTRQREFEDILLRLGLPSQHEELPDGVARHLVDMYWEGRLAPWQLAGQLGLPLASQETQAAATASLIGMLLEARGDGARWWGYAAEATRDGALMRRLIAEGGRRGLSFPMIIRTPDRDVELGGQTAPAGEPVIVSLAAANMDPARFGDDAQLFDPRAERPPHLAFSEGRRRCLGEVSAEQFMEDVLRVCVDVLPPSVQLENGMVLREIAGISWSIPQLPIIPG
jgi:cytochrome P450